MLADQVSMQPIRPGRSSESGLLGAKIVRDSNKKRAEHGRLQPKWQASEGPVLSRSCPSFQVLLTPSNSGGRLLQPPGRALHYLVIPTGDLLSMMRTQHDLIYTKTTILPRNILYQIMQDVYSTGFPYM